VLIDTGLAAESDLFMEALRSIIDYAQREGATAGYCATHQPIGLDHGCAAKTWATASRLKTVASGSRGRRPANDR
jgi:hypothetical protein